MVAFLFHCAEVNKCGIYRVDMATAETVGLADRESLAIFAANYPDLAAFDQETGEVALLNWPQVSWIFYPERTFARVEKELKQVNSVSLLQKVRDKMTCVKNRELINRVIRQKRKELRENAFDIPQEEDLRKERVVMSKPVANTVNLTATFPIVEQQNNDTKAVEQPTIFPAPSQTPIEQETKKNIPAIVREALRKEGVPSYEKLRRLFGGDEPAELSETIYKKLGYVEKEEAFIALIDYSKVTAQRRELSVPFSQYLSGDYKTYLPMPPKLDIPEHVDAHHWIFEAGAYMYFEKVWQLEKRGVSKAFSRRCFYKQSLKNRLLIAAGLINYGKYIEKNKTPKGMIQHLSTFINRQTYLDYLQPKEVYEGSETQSQSSLRQPPPMPPVPDDLPEEYAKGYEAFTEQIWSLFPNIPGLRWFNAQEYISYANRTEDFMGGSSWRTRFGKREIDRFLKEIYIELNDNKWKRQNYYSIYFAVKTMMTEKMKDGRN